MKKIFCIFAVVLILIIATVPCFAADNDDYCYLLFQSNGTVAFNNIVFSRTSGLTRLNSSTVTLTVSNIDSVIDVYINGVFYGSTRANNIGYSLTVSSGDYILICYNGYSCYSVSGIQPENIVGVFGDRFSIYNAGLETYYFAGGPTCKFDCPQGFYSVDHQMFYSEPTTFSVNRDYSFSTVSQFFSPLTNFYSSWTHSFDYFSSLISSYSGVFIFVLSIVFILFMIFVIAMVIRRCRNI